MSDIHNNIHIDHILTNMRCERRPRAQRDLFQSPALLVIHHQDPWAHSGSTLTRRRFLSLRIGVPVKDF